jgi:hypothetical protein
MKNNNYKQSVMTIVKKNPLCKAISTFLNRNYEKCSPMTTNHHFPPTPNPKIIYLLPPMYEHNDLL